MPHMMNRFSRMSAFSECFCCKIRKKSENPDNDRLRIYLLKGALCIRSYLCLSNLIFCGLISFCPYCYQRKAVLEDFAKNVINRYGRVDVLVNNAPPSFIGIDSCTYEQFQRSLAIGVTAPFYLSKLFSPYFTEGASIINISSSRDRMSHPQTESYTAAKGGISALTHALAISFSGKVRVNSISPGWIDRNYTVYEGPDALQQPVGRVGNPLDIANMVLFLASDKAGFITGENICIDGGQTKLMIYHDEHGWTLTP